MTVCCGLLFGSFTALAVLATAFSDGQNNISSFHKHRASSSSAVRASRDEQSRGEPNEMLRQSIKNLASILDSDQSVTPMTQSSDCSSTVHIIGTGLNPSLSSLPLSTLHILSEADVVLCDSLGLSYEDICQIVPKDCEVICVGKRGDSAKSWKQDDIDQLLLKLALKQHTKRESETRRIVRLKAGDPFLFGRTRSEIEALRANNISYTYTPAISSCIAGPHLGGIPLTDAELNCQSFGVRSGTDAFDRSYGLNDEGSETEFVSGVDVLVFLMIGRLDKLEALCQLLAKGRGGRDISDTREWKWNVDTPCAVIQNAGGISPESILGSPDDQSQTPVQRVWRSTLGSIVLMIRSEDDAQKCQSGSVHCGKVCKLDLR